MSRGGRRALMKTVNPNNLDLVLKETFKRETKYIELYTQFSPNYVKMGDIVTGKITECNLSTLSHNSLESGDTSRIERNNQPTTSSEYGYFPGPLTIKFTPVLHYRTKCDVTKLAEDQYGILQALKRDEIKVDRNKKIEETSENVVD